VGRGTILLKLAKGDRLLGFTAAPKDEATLTMTTNRGAQKKVDAGSYGITSRAGRGRELLKNGTLTAILRPEVPAPPLFEGQEGAEETAS
jgi:DNA gyrase subunit A